MTGSESQESLMWNTLLLLLLLLLLWGIEPLLGKDLETNETITVAMQRRGKHASTRIKLLLETVFSTRSLQRSYLEDNWGHPVSS
jgi:hypothetical protein